jgi:hypothetical protein
VLALAQTDLSTSHAHPSPCKILTRKFPTAPNLILGPFGPRRQSSNTIRSSDITELEHKRKIDRQNGYAERDQEIAEATVLCPFLSKRSTAFGIFHKKVRWSFGKKTNVSNETAMQRV